MDIFIEYELFGYLALIFNLTSFLQKETKNTLIFLTISSTLFIINMFVLELPLVSIYIVCIGLFLTIISLIFINYHKFKNFLIKISPLFMLAVIYLYGFDYLGFFSGLGFLFATIAKLQEDIFSMKIYLLLSTVTWLFIMIYLGYVSFIVFYTAGTFVLLYEIKKLYFSNRSCKIY